VYCFTTAPATAKMAVHAAREVFMPVMRFLLMPIRTNKQGVQVNVGKDGDEYNAIVNTMTMHPDDMKELGITSGATVRVRTEIGEATFQCKEANVPRGLLFVPYGPPTCRLMGGETDGTGMPTSKGWDVEVEPA
jgi:formylmethanofuran dehydrogenase subunit D